MDKVNEVIETIRKKAEKRKIKLVIERLKDCNFELCIDVCDDVFINQPKYKIEVVEFLDKYYMKDFLGNTPFKYDRTDVKEKYSGGRHFYTVTYFFDELKKSCINDKN